MWNWEGIGTIGKAKSEIEAETTINLPFENRLKHLVDLIDVWDFVRVLDFGCGIGRHIKWLRGQSKGQIITGYDFPNMVVLAKEYLGEEEWLKVRWINPPMSNLFEEQFDLIVCSLVLQHMSKGEVQLALSLFAEMLGSAGRLLVHSRVESDSGFSVWDLIQAKFDVVVEVEEPEKKFGHHYAKLLKVKEGK